MHRSRGCLLRGQAGNEGEAVENQKLHPDPYYRAPSMKYIYIYIYIYVPPKRTCHTGAVVVEVGREILAVSFGRLRRQPRSEALALGRRGRVPR